MRYVSRVLWPCLIVSIALLGLHQRDPGGDPLPPEQTVRASVMPFELALPVADPEPERHVERALLGRGGTLDGTLAGLSLLPGERVGLLAALKRHVDLRRLPPETGIAVIRDEDGELLGVSCRTERERFVRALRSEESGWSVEPVDVPRRTHVETAAGVVSSSVAQALAGYPRGTLLTGAFADIFQWDVDLLVDPRPGDVVRLVYETHWLGEGPEDLPGFGERDEADAGSFLGLGRVIAAAYEGERVRSTAYWVESDTGRSGYYDDAGQPMRKTFLRSPLNYSRITSGFSTARRNPVTRRVVPHHGVDFAAPTGTPVVATADGRVIRTGWQGALGRAVTIRHGNGYETIYGHLSRFGKNIRPGVRVSQDQLIGHVGSTGRATGPHLHYTLKRHGRALDPMRFRSPPAESLDPADLPALQQAMLRWSPVLAEAGLDSRTFRLAEADDGRSHAGRGPS